jgi:hypothetical protein
MSDVLDGKLARSRGTITEFGKFLDPVADKFMIGTAMVSLSILGRMPWWITIVILTREIGITIFRLAVIKRGVIPANKGGKIKALGLAGAKRSPLMPDVPTLAEQGIPNVNIGQWYALFAPAKTPSAVIQRLNKEVNIVLNDKANEKKIEDQGAEVETGTPEQLKTLVQKELVRWRSVVATAKITAD